MINTTKSLISFFKAIATPTKQTGNSRRVVVSLWYNGTSLVNYLSDCQESFKYTDVASGSSDSISVGISDPADKWIGAWMPQKGDTVSATIELQNWETIGQRKKLACGSFTLDEVSISGGTGGNSITIGAVSAPANVGFTETKNSKTWENTTVKLIAESIAKSNGVTLVYDARSISVSAAEQSNESDSSFLLSLCEDYGLSLKVYANKIVIFDREVYKAKATVKTINRADVSSWNWNTELLGSYTGGKLTYTDEDGDEFEVTVGTPGRMLNIHKNVSSTADATLKLNAALNNENHSTTTMDLTTMGDTDLIASQTIDIEGWSDKIDGKYYIDSVEHSIGNNGYKCKYKLSKCDPASAFGVISEAINKLVKLGIINNREWWLNNYSFIPDADTLIIAFADKLKKSPTNTSRTLDEALITLWRAQIVSLLKYISLRYSCKEYPQLEALILAGANAV